MATWKAYDKQTGVEINPGDMIETFRGETRIFEKVSRDGGPGYSPKVLTEGLWPMYADVFPGIVVRAPEADQ